MQAKAGLKASKFMIKGTEAQATQPHTFTMAVALELMLFLSSVQKKIVNKSGEWGPVKGVGNMRRNRVRVVLDIKRYFGLIMRCVGERKKGPTGN